MAWATPAVFVSGNVLTAPQLNVLTADLAETMPAKAPQSPDLFTTSPYYVATGSHALTIRQTGSSADTTTDTTASLSFGDLAASVGPAVTVTTGTMALVCMQALVTNSNASAVSSVSYAVSGATTVTPVQIYLSLSQPAAPGSVLTACAVHMETGLTPGVNTFTMKYVVGAGTGTFSRRYLSVVPF